MIPKSRTFRFGPFTFSRERGLWKGNQPVTLRHIERQLLKCLLDRPNELVRRTELEAAVWPEARVDRNTLNVHIARLRSTLEDTNRPHQLLRASSRIGYTLVAEPKLRGERQARERRPRGDQARFIRDVTIPDGALMAPGERFEKVWEIQNVGSVAWRGRAIRRTGAAQGLGRITSEPTTAIPDTPSGVVCLVRTSLVAPTQPGSYFAAWKMITADGKESLPMQSPLFVAIDVVVDRE